MTYSWEDQATKLIRRTDTVERVETFTLDDLKAEKAQLAARQEALDRDWEAFKTKVAAIQTTLKVAAKDLPTVEAIEVVK